MEQHPVPRQITTFEFKLIGFLTVKQFIYIVVFIPLGFIILILFPIPILNIFLGVLVGSIGFALALLPINDRPLDVWIKNFYKRITSPTQYIYHKENQPIYFFQDLYFLADPHHMMTHIDSKEKLAAYLAKTRAVALQNKKQQQINVLSQKQPTNLIHKTTATTQTVSKPPPVAVSHPAPQTQLQVAVSQYQVTTPKKPFFTGVVKNHKHIPLPGILIYVKDEKGKMLRLLKSNPHGVFATFNPLPTSEYILEMKDTGGTHFFDTMEVRLAGENPKPIEIFSKELL